MTMKQAPDRSLTAEGHAGNAVVTGASNTLRKPSGLCKSVNGAVSPSLVSTFNLRSGGGELHGESLGKNSRTVTTADGSTKGSKESKELSSQSGRTDTGNSNTFKHNSNGSAPSLQTLAMMSRLAGIPGSSLFNSSDAVSQILKNIERAGGINSGNDTHPGNYQDIEGLNGEEEGPQTAQGRGMSRQNGSGYEAHHGGDGSDGDSERKHGGGSAEENEKGLREDTEESNRDSEDLSSGRDAEDMRKDERQSTGADGKRSLMEEEDISNPSLSEAERRKLKRRIANRESARRVRQKKQEMLEELQMKCTALTQQNARLLAAAANVETQRQDAVRRMETFEHHMISLTKENVALKSHKSILTDALKAHNISAEAILEKQATKVEDAQKRTEKELQKIVNGHLPALTSALQQQQFHPMIPSNVNGMLNPTMAVSPSNGGSFQGGGNQPGMHGMMNLTSSMMSGGNANAAMLNAQVSRMMFPNSGAMSSALAMPPMPLGASPHQIFK